MLRSRLNAGEIGYSRRQNQRLVRRLCIVCLCVCYFTINCAWAQTAPDYSQPTASILGTTGLWKVFVPGTLAAKQSSISASYDRINRNPGNLTISTTAFGAAV